MPTLLLLALATWPAAEAVLSPPPPARATRRPLRVALDAGHGAPGNQGARGCDCGVEEDFTLFAAQQVATALRATKAFDVLLTRRGAERPRYAERVRRAERRGAEAIVSLHSDVRGYYFWRARPDGRLCPASDAAPGFSVLWSEEGPPGVVAARAALGRALGRRLREAGFPAYDGADYVALYRQDPVEPSGWIDLRPRRRQVWLLRASAIPTVIVETHHALDEQEARRWREPATLEAFARALGAALQDVRARRRAAPVARGDPASVPARARPSR